MSKYRLERLSSSAVMQRTVIQCWQALAQARLILRIYICNHHARSAWKPGEHDSPRIDNHAVAMSFAAIEMTASLSWSHHIREIFNGAGTNQCFPVCLAGSCGKSSRGENDVHLSHGTEEF